MREESQQQLLINTVWFDRCVGTGLDSLEGNRLESSGVYVKSQVRASVSGLVLFFHLAVFLPHTAAVSELLLSRQNIKLFHPTLIKIQYFSLNAKVVNRKVYIACLTSSVSLAMMVC